MVIILSLVIVNSFWFFFWCIPSLHLNSSLSLLPILGSNCIYNIPNCVVISDNQSDVWRMLINNYLNLIRFWLSKGPKSLKWDGRFTNNIKFVPSCTEDLNTEKPVLWVNFAFGTKIAVEIILVMAIPHM